MVDSDKFDLTAIKGIEGGAFNLGFGDNPILRLGTFHEFGSRRNSFEVRKEV